MKDFLIDYIGKAGAIARKDGLEVAKSAILDSSLSGTYALGVESEDAFWDKVVDQSVMMRLMGIRFTKRPKISSNELTLGTNGEDVLRPSVTGTDPGDTVTAADAERTFVLEEVKAIACLGDDVIEDTLESTGFEDHFLSMVARAVANELDNAILNGYKVGTGNSQRGSITGCFDGILQQIAAGGTTVHATAYSDRYTHVPGVASYSAANDKHLIVLKSLPTKYDASRHVFLTPRSPAYDMWSILANRATPFGDANVQGIPVYVNYAGRPMIEVPKMRTNYLVKGTGKKKTTNPGATQINGTGVAKARATTLTVDGITNFANNDKIVIGAADAGAAAFFLHAEERVQSGTPSGAILTVSAAMTYDHADNEYVEELTTSVTADGIAQLFIALENLRMFIMRGLQVEVFREPRKSQTSHVFKFKGVPVVANPDNAVLLRDLKSLT